MEDFQDAAKRHLDDAELLFSQEPKRLANASHLFGVSAECALKAILDAKNKDSFNPKKSGHVPKLFTQFIHVTPNIDANLANSVSEISKLFSDWDVSQRYVPQSIFIESDIALQKNGATNALFLMKTYLSGGVL
jgi:hypothetical protein